MLLDRNREASAKTSCSFCACGVALSKEYLAGFTFVNIGGGVG